MSRRGSRQDDAGRFRALLDQVLGRNRVTSYLRTVAENAAAGGAPNSQHLTGTAADADGSDQAGLVARARRAGLVAVPSVDRDTGLPFVHLQLFPRDARSPDVLEAEAQQSANVQPHQLESVMQQVAMPGHSCPCGDGCGRCSGCGYYRCGCVCGILGQGPEDEDPWFLYPDPHDDDDDDDDCD